MTCSCWCTDQIPTGQDLYVAISFDEVKFFLNHFLSSLTHVYLSFLEYDYIVFLALQDMFESSPSVLVQGRDSNKRNEETYVFS